MENDLCGVTTAVVGATLKEESDDDGET